MPILTLQRKLREVGRIRIGQQVPTSNGRSRPKKLDKFRLTSKDGRVIQAAAEVYGGAPAPWAAPDGPQFEVVTDAVEIPVVVPPGEMAMTQWYELWSGGGCQRRCDGASEVLSDGPCICDTEGGDRQCKITTRLSVMVPDIPGFGLWRLESHGYYAGVELAGAVDLCRRASQAGHLLPARLRLEHRQVKRDGKTHKFAVPVLDLDVSVSALGELGAGPGAATVGSLAEGSAGALPSPSGWSPVGELPEGPGASVAEQVAAVADPEPRRPRSNAAAPIQRTGLRPRTAAEADGPAQQRSAPSAPASGSPKGAYFARHEDAARLAEIGVSELRKRLILILTSGELDSASGWADDDERWVGLNRLLDKMLEEGKIPYPKTDGSWQLRKPPAAPSAPPTTAVPEDDEVVDAEVVEETPAGAPIAAGDADGWLELDSDDWRAAAQQAGVGIAALIRKAQELAEGLGVDGPGSVPQLAEGDEGLRRQVGAWLEGQAR